MISNQNTATTLADQPDGFVMLALEDISSAFRDLKQAGFTLTSSDTKPAYVATLDHNGFRIKATLNLLKTDHPVGLSRIGVNGDREFLELRNGRLYRGVWQLFTVDDAAHQALRFVRRIGANVTAETMTVRVRNHDAEPPWGSGPTSPVVSTITISATCPVCGGQRGEARSSNQSEDGTHFAVDVWENPCGHVDYYVSVLAEAAAKAGAQR